MTPLAAELARRDRAIEIREARIAELENWTHSLTASLTAARVELFRLQQRVSLLEAVGGIADLALKVAVSGAPSAEFPETVRLWREKWAELVRKGHTP